jgi:hypothetical protein
MAVKLDFDRLADIARVSNWENFWTEYLKQWHAGGGDPNIPIDKVMQDARASYQGYISKPSEFRSKNDSGSSSSSTVNGPGGSGNYAQKMLSTQMREKTGDRGEFGTLEKSLGVFFDESGKFRKMGVFKALADLMKNEVLVYLDQQSQLLSKINEKAGMTGQLSEAFREEIMSASPEVIRLGVSFEEMTESVSNLVAQSGKFRLLSEDTIKDMALASKFTDDMGELADMGLNFEKIGLGVKDMSGLIEKMGMRSMVLGLNARTTTKMVNEQLKNLNSYGFKEGIEGLNKMAQKSVEFRMNMESVFKMGEKVWDPEGALNMVANLQVIGGAFGDLNDPIKLMYMATNNVEGLQEAIIGASKSLVTFNEEQGRFQVTGVNLRRAKAMADELGISMEELTTTAVAAMERTSAASDLMASGLQMRDEDKEFLTNLAQMKGGKMVIEVPKSLQDQLGNQTEIALDAMTQEQTNLLLEQKKAFEKMSMEDIARQQVTAMENIERDVSYLRAVARVGLGKEVGDLIEKTLGINQKVISQESKKMTTWVADKMYTKGSEWSDTLYNALGIAKSTKSQGTINAEAKAANLPREENKISATSATNTTVPVTKQIVEFKLSSGDVSMDELKRRLWSDPTWMNRAKNDFINNVPTGK